MKPTQGIKEVTRKPTGGEDPWPKPVSDGPKWRRLT